MMFFSKTLTCNLDSPCTASTTLVVPVYFLPPRSFLRKPPSDLPFWDAAAFALLALLFTAFNAFLGAALAFADTLDADLSFLRKSNCGERVTTRWRVRHAYSTITESSLGVWYRKCYLYTRGTVHPPSMKTHMRKRFPCLYGRCTTA